MSGPLFFELFTFVAFLAINVFIIDRVCNMLKKKHRVKGVFKTGFLIVVILLFSRRAFERIISLAMIHSSA